MANVELAPDSRVSLDSVPASQDTDTASDPRGDHEAEGVVDRDPSSRLEPEVVKDVVGDVFTAPAKDATKDKAAKPASGKVNSSTPTHKKAAASATLSAASVKAGKTATASPSSPLSKTASPKKPAVASSATSKTSSMASSRGSGPAPPARRSSMLPPRASSATGAPPPKSRTSTLLASLASSASSRPSPAEAIAASRQSAASPVPSVSSLKSNSAAPPRPRAPVSEAVRRTPSSSRPSLPPAPAQPPQRPGVRPMGSISSVRELPDDGKSSESVQEQLRAKIAQLEASLNEALVDVKTKTSSIEQLQTSKQSSDAQVSDLKARLQQLQAEHARDLAAFKSVKEQLNYANASMTGQTENIKTLEAQVETLHADIAAAQENFESLRVSSDQSSAAAAAAAQMEREAFLRAKADIETVTAELNGLRAVHERVSQEAAARSSAAQLREAEVVALTTQIGELKAEREESAAKISELEIETLELKESQENAEDEHNRTLDRLEKLEVDLNEATAATEQAVRRAEAQGAEHKQMIADAASRHAHELQLVNSDLAQTVSELEVLQSELAAAHVAHDETKAAARASAEAHEQEMEETEQSYLSKHIELSEEIKRLTVELEGEEAKYRAKIDALEAEHDQLLMEAFERAKNEAGEAHGQDLQALRVESHATIEQLRVAHQSTIDDLRVEHETDLASQVNAMEKKFNNQSLELRATQDDLSKAKATLDTLRAEGESLKTQLEDARASSTAASASADQAAEIDRLTKELGNLRDENVMLNDVLAVTKESLSEMSTNHSKELEEAARIRVEEVMGLRSIHEGELSTVAAQKSELALALSDLQGEITMLKAQLAAAEPTAAPRSNGATHASATQVTRDELHKVHEAHNLKMHDLQAEHDRVVRGLRAEVESLQARLDEVQQDVARKSMEIQYLEQEQEESQDSITRYVKVFGLQSLFGVVIALAVIFDFI